MTLMTTVLQIITNSLYLIGLFIDSIELEASSFTEKLREEFAIFTNISVKQLRT